MKYNRNRCRASPRRRPPRRRPPGNLSLFLLMALLLFSGRASLGAQNPSAADWNGRGRAAMEEEDWYTAAEAFLEAVKLNPAHAEANAALAECYYELGEFDEALAWVQKARALARTDSGLANLEAFIYIALGRLEEASGRIAAVLVREPYNKEALFAQAELDIARGRAGDAVIRYREAVRRFPDDRRLLISLALALGSLGDTEGARAYIERAREQHPGDYRVYYYAAYLDSRAGRLQEAAAAAEKALYYRPTHAPSRSLLASLRYRSGRYEEASALADELIARKREDTAAWYLKGMSAVRMGRSAEAISTLSAALSFAPQDEFIRFTLEDLLISGTGLEDPRRRRWAAWHFDHARSYRALNLTDQALFEYRRGLRLNPYARDRREYADLLRLQGYPARYLEELKLLQNLSRGDKTLGDKNLDDAVESYEALLGNALFRRWGVEPVAVTQPHWKVAVFSVASQSAFFHADAGAAASAYVRDLLAHERNIAPMEAELRQPSFSRAFRTAREGEADYFLIVSVAENERDISLKGELYVARTGAPAAVFSTYRTGADRLRDAGRGIVDQLASALPFRGRLIRRRQSLGLIDKGRADGVAQGAAYEVVKQGRLSILNEGIGLSYTADDVVGKLTIESADEELASGTLARRGFFDRISEGDEIFLVPEKSEDKPPPAAVADPELRSLLRTLR